MAYPTQRQASAPHFDAEGPKIDPEPSKTGSEQPPTGAEGSPARAFRLTFFENAYATRKTEQELTLDALATSIQAAHAPEKAPLRWLKLARFGDVRSDKGSLRHDGNVLAVTGVEGDYDGKEVAFATAREILRKAGSWRCRAGASSARSRPSSLRRCAIR
jgi:hypothetical protein